jgi:hypothetical protein
MGQEAQALYDPIMSRSRISKQSAMINEDKDEDQVDFEDDGSSSTSEKGASLKRSVDFKGQIQLLKDENEDLKRDYDRVQDKNTSLEDDLRALQLQNKALKLENDTLNRLVEFNKASMAVGEPRVEKNPEEKDAE